MDNGASSYRRFLDGDESGFIEIVEIYKDGLILYLNSFTHDLRIAEELAEDTFVKIGIKKPTHRQLSSFKTWLYAIARNIAKDYIRKNNRIQEVVYDEGYDYCQEMNDLESSYFHEERKRIIHHALKQLKPEYQQVLWLIYFEDFSHQEVAKIMRKTVHGIDTLVYRARKSLKSQLEKEGFVYEN